MSEGSAAQQLERRVRRQRDDGAGRHPFDECRRLLFESGPRRVLQVELTLGMLAGVPHERHGLTLNDVRSLTIHGGSLRLFVSHQKGESGSWG